MGAIYKCMNLLCHLGFNVKLTTLRRTIWVFVWIFHIINHLGSDRSSTIANNFCKFQVMFLFSWSTMTKMTFISIREMYTISSIKKYNLLTRGFWIHTTSNEYTLSLTKRMTWHFTFLCPTKPWRMFFKSWRHLWKTNLHPFHLLSLFERWNFL